MSDQSYSRRQFLLASLGITGLSTGASAGRRPSQFESTARQPSESADEFVLEQDETCVSVTPLRFQEQTIQEFYGVEQPQYAGFHRPEASSTATGLERAQTSRLFLYDGPDGLGYGILHGAADGPGGAASFAIRHSPRSGKLYVQDDPDDSFRCRPNCSLNWAWGADDASDGAVYQPLASEFEVEIDPAFNEHAVREAPTGGAVERWQVLSGDVRNPDVTDLALDQPVTLRSGSC